MDSEKNPAVEEKPVNPDVSRQIRDSLNAIIRQEVDKILKEYKLIE